LLKLSARGGLLIKCIIERVISHKLTCPQDSRGLSGKVT